MRKRGPQKKSTDLMAYLRLVEKLSPGTLTRNANEVAEAMLAEDDAALRAAAIPRKRGRPPTPQKHLRIMCTVEAYIGAGLRRKGAINRAAEHWLLAPSSIDEIYRDNKLLKPQSKAIRDYFEGDTLAEIDEQIRLFREAERGE
jgi:hypothetical protein